MKKKTITVIIGIGLLSVAIWGIYLAKNHAEQLNPQGENSNLSIKVIDVEKVVKTPEQYRDFVGVEGKVIKVDESKSIFLLGCADACIFMPVKYKGKMPEQKSEIIVYGEIKKQEDGRYIFQGEKVKTK